MLVRAATLEDHDRVMELMCFLQPNDPKLSEAESQSIFSEIVNSRRFIILVAEKHKCIASTCYINIIPNLTRHAAPYAVIENVVTHPDFRRQGIGKALMTHALELAKTVGCYKVMLLTGGDQDVLEFYKSCGMKSGVKTAFIERW